VSRTGYLAALAALGLGGWIAATVLSGARPAALGTGLALAVVIQGSAWWKLTAALARGSAMRSWIAGMAARVGGFAFLWVVAGAAGLRRAEAIVPYGLALLVFLLLEAGWLARRPRRMGNRAVADELNDKDAHLGR